VGILCYIVPEFSPTLIHKPSITNILSVLFPKNPQHPLLVFIRESGFGQNLVGFVSALVGFSSESVGKYSAEC
jgi:hypothetical protein